LGSKIKDALTNPNKAIKYLALGKEEYETLQNLTNHSCTSGINAETPLEKRMIVPTDIHEHLSILHMLTIEFNLKNILELGTRTGESTIALLQAATEIDGFVTSIDIDSCNDAKKIVNKFSLEKNWKFIQSNDLEINWDKTIDHLFIDTSHTYEQTLAELKKFGEFVRPGGIISLHDLISHKQVFEAINDYIKTRDDLRFYKFFHNNGLGIIKVTNTS
tara:strand:+ start:13830 stop:14483 length:654 start_codon:yes stop_codon:yes gene_type:complete